MVHRSGDAIWIRIGLQHANVSYDEETSRGSKRAHFRCASTFVTAAFMTAAAGKRGLHAMREHLVHDIRSSPAISNDGGSRGAVVVGFGAFRVVDDGGVAEREAACEGI